MFKFKTYSFLKKKKTQWEELGEGIYGTYNWQRISVPVELQLSKKKRQLNRKTGKRYKQAYHIKKNPKWPKKHEKRLNLIIIQRNVNYSRS